VEFYININFKENKRSKSQENVKCYWFARKNMNYVCGSMTFFKQLISLKNEGYITWVSCNLISSTIVSYFVRFWCCRRFVALVVCFGHTTTTIIVVHNTAEKRLRMRQHYWNLYCERVLKCSECCQKLKMDATSMFCLFYENASGITNVTTQKLEIIIVYMCKK
jgi:hypothetical protein